MKDIQRNEQIKKILSDDFNRIFDQFMQEKVDTAMLFLMPPKDKVPEIDDVKYLQALDAFEILIKKDHDNYINGNGIDFSRDDNGRLTAVRIKKFSHLDDKKIRGNLISTIEKEKELLCENIETKPDIVNYVVDKRILVFLELLIKKYYTELKKVYLNNA